MRMTCNVKLVLGRSGSGKTQRLCQDMITRSIKDREHNYYMIVPEQFTMETQRRMSKLHPDGGIIDIDILSFDRLAYRIFEEMSVKTNQVLEDLGKTMVISHLLEVHAKELLIFGRSSHRAGFHDEMKSMICELFQYGVHREDVVSAMEALDHTGALYMKLHDLLLIYDYFMEYMEGQYIVAEQLLDYAGAYVEESHKLSGAVLYFDGFTGFTPVQYVMLNRLMYVASSMQFAITMPMPRQEFAREHHLFHMGYQTFQNIMGLLRDHTEIDFSVDNDIAELSENHRHKGSKLLAHLEQNLFTFPYRAFEGVSDDLHIFAARTAREEICETARTIRKLIAQGYRYRDIAVVTGDLGGVAYLAEELFNEYAIPYFVDQNTDMRKNPFVSWLLSLWRIVAYGYRRTDVIAYIKSGYCRCVRADQAGLIENYALARNVNSKSGFGLVCRDENVESLRQAFMEEMQMFENMIEGQTVRDYLKAVYQFSCELELEDKLSVQAQQFADSMDHAQAGIYEQIYGKTMELFDKLVDILGDEKMKSDAFYTVLEAGVMALDIGMIPQGQDHVIMGDIMRTRLQDIKVLFLINANEGVIPKKGSRGTILSDRDKERLSGMITLAPSGRIKSYEEQFYLYLLLTKPSDKLYISYHKLASDNKAVRPSYLISRVTAVCPAVMIEELHAPDHSGQIYTMQEGAQLLIQELLRYREDSEADVPEDLKVLLSYYQETHEEEMMLAGMLYPYVKQDLPKNIVKALYGDQPEATISRLERYAGCAYAYFLEYGLRLKEQQMFEVKTSDTGTILHAVMEQVFTWFEERKGIRLASEAEVMEQTRKTFAAIISQEEYRELFSGNGRNAYLYQILERVCLKSMHVLKRQLASGSMNPTAFELTFGSGKLSLLQLRLSDSVTMNLKGVIDRVDVFVDDAKDCVYVQIIDYKSGNKDIDYTKLYYGLQIQLLVYMRAVCAWAKTQYPDRRIVPVGMYYFHLNDQLAQVNTTEISEQEIDDLKCKNSRLNGLTIEDPERIRLIDNTAGAVLPLTPKKDGTFRDTKALVSESGFTSVCDYAMQVAAELGKKMYSGNIEVNPYRIDQTHEACTYCQYAGICMFDPSVGGGYRYFKKKTREECVANEMDS